jgi:hypothetical protein
MPEGGPSNAPRPATVTVASEGKAQGVSLSPAARPEVPPLKCETPCTLQLWPDRYRLVTQTKGIRSFTAEIDVPPTGGAWTLHAPSKGQFVGGIVLTAFGGMSLAVCGGLAIAALVSAPSDSYNQMYASIAGGVGLIVGGASLGVGIAFVTRNKRGFITEPQPPSPKASSGATRVQFFANGAGIGLRF